MKLRSDIIYKHVFFDEGGFIRKHLISSTIRPRVASVMGELGRIINAASKVYILQYYLLENDLQFYTSYDGVDALDRGVVTRFVNLRPPPLHPVRVTDDYCAAFQNLVHRYRASYDEQTDTIKERAIIFMSSSRMATMFATILKGYAPSAKTAARIYYICAENQNEAFPAAFLENPTLAAPQADMIFITSVAQVGHSIEAFNTSHCFFWSGHTTLQMEYQQQCRFRVEGRRNGILPFRFAFHQSGRADQYVASEQRMEQNLKATLCTLCNQKS